MTMHFIPSQVFDLPWALSLELHALRGLMKTAAGVAGGLVVGVAVGFGAATIYKNRMAGGGGRDPNAVVLQLDGAKYREADLPPDIRASLFEVRNEGFEKENNVLNQFALQFAMAKEKNKDVKPDALPPFDQLVEAPQPTEQEMQALYDANKARLPPNTTFEQVKAEIEKFVKNQKTSEVLRAKNEELKGKGRFAILLTPPEAPTVQLSVDQYPAKGPQGAKLLVEVADYLCPHCQATQPDVEAMLKDIGGKVRFVAVSFSLRPEGLSGTLARGAFCARQQGDEAFWKYHEKAFAMGREKGWKTTDPDDKAPVLEVVEAAGIDRAKVEACLGTPEAQKFVTSTTESMHKSGVSGTPTFFMNNRKLTMTPGKSLKENVESQLGGTSH